MRGITMTVAGLVLGACLLCQGCASPVERTPDIRAEYVWETLKARLDYPIDEVYSAASDAVHQLDLDVIYSDHDGVAGQVATVDAQREHIAIEMEALRGSRTLLTIRVQLFGDRNKSEVIFDQIAEGLRKEVVAAKATKRMLSVSLTR